MRIGDSRAGWCLEAVLRAAVRCDVGGMSGTPPERSGGACGKGAGIAPVVPSGSGGPRAAQMKRAPEEGARRRHACWVLSDAFFRYWRRLDRRGGRGRRKSTRMYSCLLTKDTKTRSMLSSF